MNKLFTCKKDEEFKYAITTSDGIYELTNESVKCLLNEFEELDIDDNGDIECVALKVIKHSTKELISGVHYVSKEAFVSDFEDISNTISNEIYDDLLITEGWKENKQMEYNSEIISDVVEHNSDYSSIFFRNVKEQSQFIRESRYFVYAPNNLGDATDLYAPAYKFQMGTDGRRIINTIYNYDYSIYENIILSGSEVESKKDDFVREMEGNGAKDIQVHEIPEELTITYFKNKFSWKYVTCTLHGVQIITHFISSYTSDVVTRAGIILSDTIGIELTEELKVSLIASDKSKYFTEITRLVTEWSKNYAAARKIQQLEDFAKNIGNYGERRIEREVQTAKQREDEYFNRYNAAVKAAKDLEMKLFYLKHGVSEKNDLVDLINSNPDAVASINCGSDCVWFDVKTYLLYFDLDDYQVIRKTDRNFKMLQPALKQLVDDICLTGIVKLRIEQKFSLDFDRGEARYSGSRYETKFGEGLWGLHNPHIENHSCFGTHKPHIAKAMQNFDLMTAYSQALAACSGLTWSDSVVASEFLSNTLQRNTQLKCLETQDGLMSVSEYINNFKKSGKEWKE